MRSIHQAAQWRNLTGPTAKLVRLSSDRRGRARRCVPSRWPDVSAERRCIRLEPGLACRGPNPPTTLGRPSRCPRPKQPTCGSFPRRSVCAGRILLFVRSVRRRRNRRRNQPARPETLCFRGHGRMHGDRGKAWPPTRALASGTGPCLRFVAACLPFFPRFQLGAIAIERFGIEVEHARITAAVTAFVICRGARQSRWRFVVPC